MEDTLKTGGIIDSLTDKNADGLTKALAAVEKKVNDQLNNQTPAAAEVSETEYDAVGAAIEDIKTSIEEALNSGELTQLDTANLKALRMATNELETMFGDINEFTHDANGKKYTVAVADLEKVSKALENISKAREEVGASATKALTSSKAQAENIGEMRTQLQAFAANPKGAELESANFTGYLETVDAALSNISDQRAKLGASQNRLEYTIKIIML